LLALVAPMIAACAESGASSAPTTSLPPAEVRAQDTTTLVATAAPEPTGVPGLTATDPLCAAWAAFVGTVQALGIAASFGGLSSEQFAALELQASPRLVEVAAAIDASLPTELASERTVVTEQRIGPYARRAKSAVDALTTAGVTPVELSTLSSTWQSALLERDPEAPVLAVPPIAADLQAKVDVAAASYDKVVTPFARDPSLVVDGVEMPLTEAYLVAHCPDLASSGVGDSI
jgi:hypothetical protein